MSGPSEAMEQMAERLEHIVEELGDMAMNALSRASSGDPDARETGEALAEERRLLKARRALERSIAALLEGSGRSREPLDDGA